MKPNKFIELSESGKLSSEDLNNYIQVGGDIDYKDNRGITALGYAVNNKHITVIALLLESGANPYHKFHDKCIVNLFEYPYYNQSDLYQLCRLSQSFQMIINLQIHEWISDLNNKLINKLN